MPSLLIIGCGYLGRPLAALAHSRGLSVLATTRKPTRFDELRALGAEPILFDVLAPTPLPAADFTVYAVGFDRSTGADARRVFVEGLAGTLGALPAGRFAYVSSTGVYGNAATERVDEDTPCEPTTESGRAIREAELLLLNRRPDAAIVRSAGIYGPGRLPGLEAVRAGRTIPGDPAHHLNLIHVNDLSEVVLAAGDRAAPGRIFNACDDRPLIRGDWYRALATRTNSPPPRFDPSLGERTNRRIDNRRMKSELGVNLRYGDALAALPELLPVNDANRA